MCLVTDNRDETASGLNWLRGGTGEQGLTTLNFQSLGMFPWMQQRVEPSFLGNDHNQQYQAMLAAGMQSGDPVRQQFMQLQQPFQYLQQSGSQNPLQLKQQQVIPHLVIVDGHGLAHPRQFGLACYVGVQTGLPVIGIAKKNLLPYNAKGMNSKKYVQEGFYAGKQKIGVAIRLQENKAPVFISAGNKISLDTSIAVIKQLTTIYKFPDNMRRADSASRITE